MADWLLRPARPEDIEALVGLHAEAFRGSMGVGLGSSYVRQLLEDYLYTDDAIFLVLTDHGPSLVAYVFGRPYLSVGATSAVLRRKALIGMLTHPALFRLPAFRSELRKRIGIGTSTFQSPPSEGSAGSRCEPMFSLVGIGVAEACRRQGLGETLIRAFEMEALARGFRSCELTVHEVNESAARVYERLGWVAQTKRPGPTTVRYVRSLCDP